MSPDEWIARHGFAIFVAVWLLYERFTLGRRVERILTELIVLLRGMNRIVEKGTDRLSDQDRLG